MRLTNHFIRKKVKALAGQSGKRQSNFCTLKDARHILVLFNAEDRDVVEPCLKTLRTLNKNVNVCVYVSGETVPEMNRRIWLSMPRPIWICGICQRMKSKRSFVHAMRYTNRPYPR